MQKDQTIAQPIYQNSVKQYQWGSTDPNCIVASLSNKQCKKWAQLWMGVHQNGPSLIKQSKNLAEFLEQKKLQPIDFLYKVLSIEKCLSIQVHPNKKQAEILHKEKPNIYVDNNDKPEMFMTISDFQCFMGLISSKQFERIVGYEPFVSRFKQKQSLRDLLLQILDCQQAQIQQIINALFQQDCLMLRKIYDKSENCRVQLMKRLQEQFPYDVGIIVTMLLQYHNIPKKHCFYIKPKIAHAYIKGQCFQIMKNSDNVVRLGLTGKLKDIDTMMSILDFSDENNCLHQVQASKQSENCLKYEANHLILSIIEYDCQFINNFNSIGIVLQGQFKIGQQQNLFKGRSIFLSTGTHSIKGKGTLVIGSYSQ